MKKTPFLVIPCALSLSMPALAGGAEPVTLSGKIFSHWGMDLSEGADSQNEFDIDRLYVHLRRKLDQGFSVRMTTDVSRVEGEGSLLRPHLKYAYVQMADVAPGITLRAGMAANSLADLADDFWRHRYIYGSFVDTNQVMASSDLGIYALGEHADGAVNWQAAVVNGSGYGQPESAKGKLAQGQVSYDLLNGSDSAMPVVIYASTGLGTDETETVIAGVLGFDNESITAWAEALTATTGDTASMGYSASLVPHIANVNLIFRYDHFDADTAVDADAKDTWMAGVGNDFIQTVSLALVYEHTSLEALPDTPSHGIFLRTQAHF